MFYTEALQGYCKGQRALYGERPVTTIDLEYGGEMQAQNSKMTDFHAKVKLFSCGFVSGLLQAGAFNPWDRALYLSVKMNRKFLDLRNFEHPMAGAMQTIVQRAISAGLYFPFEELFVEFFSERLSSKPLATFLAGISAGAVNGLIMNPVSAIKYNYWGQPEAKGTFITTASTMFRAGGIRPFFVGATATILRDLGFGGTFAFLRHEFLGKPMSKNMSNSIDSSKYNNRGARGGGSNADTSIISRGNSSIGVSDRNDKIDLNAERGGDRKTSKTKANSFIVNLFSACIATIASSPLNYVRNIHYATPPSSKAEGSMKILSDLWIAASNEPTLYLKLRHLQSRLRIGWGTARVGCGMAFGAAVYNFCSKGEQRHE